MDLISTTVSLLQSDVQLQLLNDIDTVPVDREQCHLSVPQLVFWGNHSCGKSSLLETLSGVKFPSASDSCTKFAIVVNLRKSPEPRAMVSITLGNKAAPERCIQLKSFARELLDLNGMQGLVEEAKAAMGVQESNGISDEVLELTISGPNLSSLRLVDLPAFILVPGRNEDTESVNNLAKSYMKQEGSVILAVISPTDDLTNQEVLSFAKNCDPARVRTIGIIAKPDHLTQEQNPILGKRYLGILKNQDPAFRCRSWHVIRNSNSEERKNKDFDHISAEKDLFIKFPLNNLLKVQLGIDSLRKSLRDCLQEQIQFQLPRLITSIETEIKHSTKIVDTLGGARTSSIEQRRYLMRLSRKYEQLVEDAMSGQYAKDEFFISPAARLRAQIRRLTEDFEADLKLRGHTYEMTTGTSDTVGSEFDFAKMIIMEQSLINVGRLGEEYKGSEIPGTYNQSLVTVLFRQQSKKWRQIALGYWSKVRLAVNDFLVELLRHITSPESRMAGVLQMHVFDAGMKKIGKDIEKKIEELMTPYTDFPLFMTESRLESSLSRIDAEDRAKEISEPPLSGMFVGGAECLKLLRASRAYYQVALEHFVDNMAILGVENCVLRKLPALFCVDSVMEDMDDEKLQLLAGQPEGVSTRRFYERQKLDRVEESLKLYQKYAIRRPDRINDAAQAPFGALSSNAASAKVALVVRNTQKSSSDLPSEAKSQSSLFGGPSGQKASSALCGMPPTNTSPHPRFGERPAQKALGASFDLPPTNKISTFSFGTPTAQKASSPLSSMPPTNTSPSSACGQPTTHKSQSSLFGGPSADKASSASFGMPAPNYIQSVRISH